MVYCRGGERGEEAELIGVLQSSAGRLVGATMLFSHCFSPLSNFFSNSQSSEVLSNPLRWNTWANSFFLQISSAASGFLSNGMRVVNDLSSLLRFAAVIFCHCVIDSVLLTVQRSEAADEAMLITILTRTEG